MMGEARDYRVNDPDFIHITGDLMQIFNDLLGNTEHAGGEEAVEFIARRLTGNTIFQPRFLDFCEAHHFNISALLR